MKYQVNIIHNVAFVHGNVQRGEHVSIFGDGVVHLSMCDITVESPSLQALFHLAERGLKDLVPIGRKASRKDNEWKIGNHTVFSSGKAGIGTVMTKTATFVSRIRSLLEMVEIIRGMNATTNASIRLYARKQRIDGMPVDDWLAMMKEAGTNIDPNTAEIYRTWVFMGYPYNIYPDLPTEVQCTSRDFYARAPGSEFWVYSDDLPEPTRRALAKKI